MGYQQSIVKAQESKAEELIQFWFQNKKWFEERDMFVFCAVEVL